MDQKVLHTLYREPFALGHPHIQVQLPDRPLTEIVKTATFLPPDFSHRGSIAIDGQIVPKELWQSVKPKAGTVVTLHMAVAGGDGGAKSVFALVAAIALSVVTAGIAGGALAPLLGSSFAAGTLGASLLAGAVGLAGALAISALSSPPTVNTSEDTTSSGNRLEAAAVDGNVLEPNTPIPRVIGTRRAYPPFLCEPVIERIGQNDFVEAIYGLAGPHTLEDIRLGDAALEVPADDTKDVEVELRNGLPDDLPLDLIERQGRTLEPNVTLSTHEVDPENQDTLEGADPLPVFHSVTTRLDPDENWMHLDLAGLTRQDDPDDSLRIPFRMRMRRRGDTAWRDLPEFHYQNATQSSVRLQLKIFWGSAFNDTLPTPPSGLGFSMARKVVPAQDVNPIGTEFTADDYFSDGAGNDYYDATNPDTTNVLNITLAADTVGIYLDSTEWPAGIYDIEIKRGEVFRNTLFTNSTYSYNGDILDFFGQTEGGTLPVTRAGLLDQVTLSRFINIWNEYPIKQENLTLIAIKARNRRVNQLSAIASGYVYDIPSAQAGVFEKSGDGHVLWSWDNAGTVEDAEALALVRQTAVAEDAPQSAGIILRGSGSAASEQGYGLQLYRETGEVSTNKLLVYKYVAGTFTAITTVPFPWTTNKNFFLRFRVSGTTLQGKAWPASLPEPEDWLVETTDGDVTGSGWIGLYQFYAEERILANWFSVGLSGDAAPNPPSTTSSLATDFYEQPASGELNDWTSRWTTTGTNTSELTELMPYNNQQTVWSDFKTTSNPAPHFRDILIGSLNYNPVPYEIVDDAGLLAWRSRCAASDFKCDMVVEGLEIADLLRVVSSCGYARLYRSELWGVSEDKSRRRETPVQLFSPRNSSSLNWSKAFTRLPAGFRVNFRDEDNDYGQDQIIIRRSGAEESGNQLEQVTYDGLVSIPDIIQRARFDLLQAEFRSTFYTFNAPAESLVCRRGSLIAVNHDILTTHYGYARVSEVLVDEGMVTGVILDAPVEIKNEPGIFETFDVLAVDNFLEIGLQSGVGIRRTTGEVTVHAVSSATGLTSEIEFETPVPNSLAPGSPLDRNSIPEFDRECLAVVGLTGKEYLRLVVSEISPQTNLEAQLVCVDEASDIFDETFSSLTSLQGVG